MANQKKDAFQKPILLFVSGLREGEILPILEKSWIIGRDPSADVQIDSPFVSRQHAELVRDGGYWYIVDLFSRNGVIRNMVRVQPGERIALKHRDRIQISSVSTFEFQDPEDTLHESQLRMRSPGIWLDKPNRDVYVFDQRLNPPLSQQQFEVLGVLFHQQERVVTNETLAEVLWPGAAGGVESAAIDNAISRLRSRLAELDQKHVYIETVRGVGRRFVQWKAE